MKICQYAVILVWTPQSMIVVLAMRVETDSIHSRVPRDSPTAIPLPDLTKPEVEHRRVDFILANPPFSKSRACQCLR